MPRTPTHTPEWSNPTAGDPGRTLNTGAGRMAQFKGRSKGPVIDVPHLDLSRRGSVPKPLVVDVPRGTFRVGQRLAAVTLRDARGHTAVIELTHVVQQRPSTTASKDPLPTETITMNYTKID
ncbi:hypothetical protein [uncultured Erythrobacter sp.]|uniref:hypothetical protein n=1 Tax=uncultured Erythrobacter sp. TaxID=263913 RepID=UPI00260EA455|nr:hypothetical protein [uncultured Erythrobacter sp.]